MNTLDRISYSRLSGSQLERMATTALSLLASLDDPYIARQHAALVAALGMHREIRGSSAQSQYTPQINAADDMVDQLVPMLEETLKTAVSQRMFMAERAASAELLIGVMQQCDRQKLLYGGYSDQGAELAVLFQKLFAPENDSHLLTAGVMPICTALKKHAEELQALREARLSEESIGTTTREQRAIIRYRLEVLFTYVDSNIADEVAEFIALALPFGELISEVMTEYKASVTRKSKQNN